MFHLDVSGVRTHINSLAVYARNGNTMSPTFFVQELERKIWDKKPHPWYGRVSLCVYLSLSCTQLNVNEQQQQQQHVLFALCCIKTLEQKITTTMCIRNNMSSAWSSSTMLVHGRSRKMSTWLYSFWVLLLAKTHNYTLAARAHSIHIVRYHNVARAKASANAWAHSISYSWTPKGKKDDEKRHKQCTLERWRMNKSKCCDRSQSTEGSIVFFLSDASLWKCRQAFKSGYMYSNSILNSTAASEAKAMINTRVRTYKGKMYENHTIR